MIEQILNMKSGGYPIRKIAAALGCSRNTVRRYIRDEEGQNNSKKLKDVTDKEGEGGADEAQSPSWVRDQDWLEIIVQRKKGVTAKQLYRESGLPISYAQFCRALKQAAQPHVEAALRLMHQPGERAQVDYCNGLIVHDLKRGKKLKTQLFCGVLPFSSLTFGVFMTDQKSTSFLAAHDMMWAYFDGVTKYVVVDNLRAAVNKAHRFDPDCNPTYVDYANHQGFAVLPARPYTPRDKAAVESAIRVIQQSFFQEHRNSTFRSLDDLNSTFRVFLDQFNHQIMREHGVSRRQRFENEKPFLHPIPREPYELAEWRDAKVHPDCCIQVCRILYSVPYQWVGQSVRVKLTPRMVEIFGVDTEKICSHLRSYDPREARIDEEHFPPKRLQESSFEIRKLQAQARSIGPATFELIDLQLSGDRPLRYLRRVQGILRLLKDTSITAVDLEYACGQALTFNKPRVDYIKQCARYHNSNGGRLRLGVPVRNANTSHLHEEI